MHFRSVAAVEVSLK